jgi:hypothetical protein
VIDIAQMQAEIRQTKARIDALERTIHQRGFVASVTADLIRQADLPVSFLDNSGFRAYIGAVAPGVPVPGSGQIEADLAMGERERREREAATRPRIFFRPEI